MNLVGCCVDGKVRISRYQGGGDMPMLRAAYRHVEEGNQEVVHTVDGLARYIAELDIPTSRLDFRGKGSDRVSGGTKVQIRTAIRGYRAV